MAGPPPAPAASSAAAPAGGYYAQQERLREQAVPKPSGQRVLPPRPEGPPPPRFRAPPGSVQEKPREQGTVPLTSLSYQDLES